MMIFKTLNRLHRFSKDDCGANLAEFAIIIPFLAVMLAAVTEVGRFFQTYTTLSKATRTAARYMSNHPVNDAELAKAKNLMVCGKLTACAESERIMPGLTAANICIQTSGTPTELVTVSIPRTAGDCGAPLMYTPIFDIGALLHNSFSMRFPVSPSTTMWHRD